MQERPNTIARCPIPHGKSSGKQYRVGDNLTGAVAPDWVPSASRALLWLYGWWSVWLRGDFPGLRSRDVARLPHVRSFSVEHPDFICCRRNEQRPSGSGRVLPLGARGFRRFLGLSMRLVELDGNISVEFCIRRAVDGLSPRLHSRSYRRMEVGWAALALCLFGYLNVRGVQVAGWVAIVLQIAVFIPVAWLCIVTLFKLHYNPVLPFIPPGKPLGSVFGKGLAAAMWDYAGYEQL